MAGRSDNRQYQLHTHRRLLAQHERIFLALAGCLLLSECGSGGAPSSPQIQQSLASDTTKIHAVDPGTTSNNSESYNSISSNLNIQSSPTTHLNVHSGSKITINYFLPAAATQTAAQEHGKRNLQYISPSNLSISVVVTPLGGSAMSPVVGSCTIASCIVNLTANPGPNTLAFTLSDNASGTGKVLASFTMMSIIAPVAISTLNLTANPVVNSITVGLSSTLTPAGTPTSIPLTISALDSDNNTIVGPGNYVDANGNPLVLLFNITQNSNGGSGSVILKGPNRITGPGQAALYALYNGKPLTSATLSLTSNGTIAGGIGSATLTIQPATNQEFPATTPSSSPHGLALGPDRNLWFTEQNSNKIGVMTTNGSVTEYAIPSASSNPYGIITGPDGAMWFAEYGTSKIGRCTLNGTITEQSITTASAKPEFLAIGPDGNIWFSEFSTNKIGFLVPSSPSSMTEYPVPTSSAQPRGITTGPDGNVWFTEWTGNKIGRITTSGIISEYPISTASSQPNSIISGPDGNLWFTEANGNNIGKITTAGVITEYPITTAASQPYGIIIGTDNNLWFAEKSGNQISRITTSGGVTEYAVTTASSQPYALILGPDNNYWFTEGNVNQIGKFVP